MSASARTTRVFIDRLTSKNAFRIFAVLGVLLIATAAQAAGGGDDHDSSGATMEAVWQGLNLLIIVGVIVYFGRGPIGEYFATRRSGIKSDLASANELLTQAEQRNAELQRRLVDLSSEVEEIRENASRRAEEEAERIISDARATAGRIRADAQTAVDQELRRAKGELRKEAANLALDMAARKLADNVSDADRDRLIDEFIVRVEPGTAAEGAN